MLEWMISACVLILMVMLCRKLLKGKISCWVQYSLWLLVAVRLLVPVSPLESALSVANFLPEGWTGQETSGMPDGDSAGTARRAQPGQNGLYRQQKRPNLSEPDITVSVIAGRSRLSEGGYSFVGGRDLSGKRPDALSEKSIHGETAESKAWSIMGMIWPAGSCLLALWLLGVNGEFRWRVCRNRKPFEVPVELQEQLQRECGQGASAQRALPVYVTDQIDTPCMYGLLHPAIYITGRTAQDLQVLEMVLRHEQMHYRQGDHVWSAVRMLCLCVHWYNPLVWGAVRLSRQDGELACDEGVLRQLGAKNRRRYGEALLALAMEQKPTLRSSLNLATSMSDTGKQLRERLSALMTMPQMTAGTAVLAFLLTLALMACTLTGRADAREQNPASDKTAVLKMALQNDRKTADSISQGSAQYTAGIGRVDSQGTGTKAGEGREAEPGSGTEAGAGYEAGTESAVDNTGTVYDHWNVQKLAYYEEDGYSVATVTEGDITRKLTYVETSWSLPTVEAQFSKEVLYWACQALLELEQWTGTQVTEVCYCLSEFGDFSFGLTPEDMEQDRTFYSRCYNGLSLCSDVIESINYSTDIDVWYSPVKQYVVPPEYDKMTTQERLIWFFERSAIARGSKVVEVIYPYEGEDYLFRTDQGTYYDFFATEGVDTLGRGLYLAGPYEGYPIH